MQKEKTPVWEKKGRANHIARIGTNQLIHPQSPSSSSSTMKGVVDRHRRVSRPQWWKGWYSLIRWLRVNSRPTSSAKNLIINTIQNDEWIYAKVTWYFRRKLSTTPSMRPSVKWYVYTFKNPSAWSMMLSSRQGTTMLPFIPIHNSSSPTQGAFLLLKK